MANVATKCMMDGTWSRAVFSSRVSVGPDLRLGSLFAQLKTRPYGIETNNLAFTPNYSL